MPASITIRPAIASDIPTVLDLIHLKAIFDGCPESVRATPEKLHRDLFGVEPLASVLLVEVADAAIGFVSYHRIYSTFLTKPGIWMDDLYLKEEFRHQGIGKALMQQLCQIAQAMGCGRIDWTVAVENANGIRFYQRIGATLKQEVHLCRLDEQAIADFAQNAFMNAV
jgi:ribosomal protein S18 acetylase RimI-like enzyme